LNML
jgi:hypothetical protein